MRNCVFQSTFPNQRVDDLNSDKWKLETGVNRESLSNDSGVFIGGSFYHNDWMWLPFGIASVVKLIASN